MSLSDVLTSVSRWLTISVSIVFIAFGLFGAAANLIIFSRSRFFKTSIAQYILAQSSVDVINLGFGLMSQMLMNGFQIPVLSFHAIGCGIRNFTLLCCSRSSLYFKCLAAFDRWASTSRQASSRLWSTPKRARILIVINIIFWALHSIPNFILNDIVLSRGVWQCIATSKTLTNYTTYFATPVLILLVPLVWLAVFGTGSYLNIKNLRVLRRSERLEQQLTRMNIIEVLVTVIAFLPYVTQFIYSTITTGWEKSAVWAAADSVVVQIGRMCYYFSNVPAFYIYLCMSKDVRLTFKLLICKLNKGYRASQVMPLTSGSIGPTTNRMVQ